MNPGYGFLTGPTWPKSNARETSRGFERIPKRRSHAAHSRSTSSRNSPGARAPAVHGTLKLLDDSGIEGELVLREWRTGRVETTQMWGRPESVRQEFRRIRSQ